ncbi:MAG: YcxB family protein, partial [Bacteroidota bacterium]
MTLEITLSEQDYVNHQLFIASQSESVIKKRRVGRIVIPIIYLLIGVPFFLWNNNGPGIFFIIIGILWFFFYPFYSRWKYRRHYQNYIKQYYQPRIGKPGAIELATPFLKTKDETGKAQIKVEQIDQLVELPQHFLIQLKSHQTFIIPKDQVEDQIGFLAFFDEL